MLHGGVRSSTQNVETGKIYFHLSPVSRQSHIIADAREENKQITTRTALQNLASKHYLQVSEKFSQLLQYVSLRC